MKLRVVPHLLTATVVACMVAAEHVPAHAQQPPQGKRVELVARDGVHTVAFWFDCGKPGAPAALLLHDNGRTHFEWTPLVVQLQHAGIHVLALDLRGHGASQKLAPEKYQQLVIHDAAVYREMVLDAQAGIEFLQREARLPPAKIAVVGADLGSSVGFALMAANPKLPCMIALSPSLHTYGFDTLNELKRFGKRPLLIFTTKYQFSEATEAITNALRETGAVQVALFPDREARGTAMLGRPPFIERSIRSFLIAAFGLAP